MKTGEKHIPEITMLGSKLSLCSSRDLLESIGQFIVKRRKALVLSGNIHSFNLAYENGWLRDYFNQADIVRLDGAGLRLGAFILGHGTPPRMTWADFAWDLASFCQAKGFGVYFLGNRPGIPEKAAARLKKNFPRLRVVGAHHGYFCKHPGHPENERIIRAINSADPDILIVGFGMPLQEQWLKQNLDAIHCRVAMTGGAVFDWISLEKPRGPKWLTRMGMEWLWRLRLDPRRLWQRYLVGNPLFLWRVLKERKRTP